MGIINFVEYSPNNGQDNGIISITADANDGAYRSTLIGVEGGDK